jgi:hypothetical protein
VAHFLTVTDTVRLWHVASGREVRRGGWLARLWGALTRREVQRFDQHGRTATSVAFTPDGRQALATRSRPGGRIEAGGGGSWLTHCAGIAALAAVESREPADQQHEG